MFLRFTSVPVYGRIFHVPSCIVFHCRCKRQVTHSVVDGHWVVSSLRLFSPASPSYEERQNRANLDFYREKDYLNKKTVPQLDLKQAELFLKVEVRVIPWAHSIPCNPHQRGGRSALSDITAASLR